jgi:hypothetical protein
MQESDQTKHLDRRDSYCQAKCMVRIVQCLPLLEVLHIELMNKSNDEPYFQNIDQIKFAEIELVCSLSNLRELGLKNVSFNDEQLANIMNECTQLKRFQLYDYRGVLRLRFSDLPIRAPLESIAFKTNAYFVNDYVLSAIQEQCSNTLMRLELDGNHCVSNKGLIDLLTYCKRLDYLGLAQTKCDNAFLEKVLALSRDVYVDCRGSDVNLIEFHESNSLSLGMLRHYNMRKSMFHVVFMFLKHEHNMNMKNMKTCMFMFMFMFET